MTTTPGAPEKGTDMEPKNYNLKTEAEHMEDARRRGIHCDSRLEGPFFACSSCGHMLVFSKFRYTSRGTRNATCNRCSSELRSKTYQENRRREQEIIDRAEKQVETIIQSPTNNLPPPTAVARDSKLWSVATHLIDQGFTVEEIREISVRASIVQDHRSIVADRGDGS